MSERLQIRGIILGCEEFVEYNTVRLINNTHRTVKFFIAEVNPDSKAGVLKLIPDRKTKASSVVSLRFKAAELGLKSETKNEFFRIIGEMVNSVKSEASRVRYLTEPEFADLFLKVNNKERDRWQKHL